MIFHAAWRIMSVFILITMLVMDTCVPVTYAAVHGAAREVFVCKNVIAKVRDTRVAASMVAKHYQFSSVTFNALISQESAWDPFALSTVRVRKTFDEKGFIVWDFIKAPGYSARGLGQVRPSTVAQKLREKAPSDDRLKAIDRLLINEKTNLCWSGLIFRDAIAGCPLPNDDAVTACALASYYSGEGTGDYITSVFARREPTAFNQ